MPTSDIPILPEGVDKADYWIIKVHGLEAYYIMYKLTQPVLSKLGPKHDEVFLATYGQDSVYLLKKKSFTIEQIMKSTGQTREAIEKNPMVFLTVKDRPDLPRPTVAGWGEA